MFFSSYHTNLFRTQQSCFSRMFACQTRLFWETLMKESVFAGPGNLVGSGYFGQSGCFGRIWTQFFNMLVKKKTSFSSNSRLWIRIRSWLDQDQSYIILHSDPFFLEGRIKPRKKRPVERAVSDPIFECFKAKIRIRFLLLGWIRIDLFLLIWGYFLVFPFSIHPLFFAHK